MPVSFEELIIGSNYERSHLAVLWGHKNDKAISRGVFTPKGLPYIILFVTEKKQTSFTQYHDKLEDGILYMEGEKGHGNDMRIVEASNEDNKIHLFHREIHHTPFTYYGQIMLLDYLLKADAPSKYIFALDNETALIYKNLQTEAYTHGFEIDDFIPDEEGKKRITLHITYERSRKNRARAIQIHGSVCSACGFDFNEKYGSDLARSYIEVHHVRPLSNIENYVINPETDLIPLCSNCHSMAHRKSNKVLTLSELKNLIIS